MGSTIVDKVSLTLKHEFLTFKFVNLGNNYICTALDVAIELFDALSFRILRSNTQNFNFVWVHE